jgi:hypothetical protein
MEDVQYFSSDIGMTNYGWFQFQVTVWLIYYSRTNPFPSSSPN